MFGLVFCSPPDWIHTQIGRSASHSLSQWANQAISKSLTRWILTVFSLWRIASCQARSGNRPDVTLSGWRNVKIQELSFRLCLFVCDPVRSTECLNPRTLSFCLCLPLRMWPSAIDRTLKSKNPLPVSLSLCLSSYMTLYCWRNVKVQELLSFWVTIIM